jgi:hypothetical protein
MDARAGISLPWNLHSIFHHKVTLYRWQLWKKLVPNSLYPCFKKKRESQAWGCTPVIPALGRLTRNIKSLRAKATCVLSYVENRPNSNPAIL